MKPGRVLRYRPNPDGVNPSVSWSPTGCQLAYIAPDGKVALWDAQKDASEEPPPEQPAGVYAVAWRPGSTELLIAGTARKVYKQEDGGKWRPTTWAPDKTEGPWELSMTDSLAWSPDGRMLVSGGTDCKLCVWDARSGDLLWTTVLLPKGQAATFSGAGELLHRTPEADKELVYLLEKSYRQYELLTPAEFHKRIAEAGK